MEEDRQELLVEHTIRGVISAFSHSVEQRTGRPFIEFRWPNRLVYYHIVNQRADIYYQSRKQNEFENNYEDYSEYISCVEMQEIDIVECPCAPASGCTFMKSKEPLPTFLKGTPILVTKLTGDEKYNHVDWSMFKHRINSRFAASSQELFFTTKTIDDKRWLYTYITRDEKVKSVSISGVPIDPMEMALFPICGEPKPDMCDILDLPFRIEKRLINTIFSSVFEKLIGLNNATRIGDTKNDDRNSEASPDINF